MPGSLESDALTGMQTGACFTHLDSQGSHPAGKCEYGMWQSAAIRNRTLAELESAGSFDPWKNAVTGQVRIATANQHVQPAPARQPRQKVSSAKETRKGAKQHVKDTRLAKRGKPSVIRGAPKKASPDGKANAI